MPVIDAKTGDLKKVLAICSAEPIYTLTGNFEHPSDVVVGRNGEIYVLDGVNDRVKVFSRKGKYLFSFGNTGRGKGDFKFPLGIGIDDADRIYVADSGNHRIQVFNSRGRYLSQFSTETGQKQIKPSDPTDVVVNSRLKRCYVVDNDNHWIGVYNLDGGRLLKTYGTMGMEKEEFRFPFLLDIDHEGNLYVVEVINARVQVLDPDGNYLKDIGRWGVDPGEFYRPKGVAVDNTGRIFVSDSYLGVLQVFDKEGDFLSVLRDKGGSVMKFVTPTGIFIDNKMRLYVVEMLAERVSVLQVECR